MIFVSWGELPYHPTIREVLFTMAGDIDINEIGAYLEYVGLMMLIAENWEMRYDKEEVG